MATQSWVNREYRRMHPSYPHHLGASHQEVQDPVAQGGVETQGLKLNYEFGGYYGVKC